MKRKNLNLLLVFALIATMLVGCGDSAKTGVVNEIGAVEAPMAEKEVVDEPSEVTEEVAEESEVTSTETTEVSTPEPTEEVTPEPTEEPESTPTPEPTKESESTPAPAPEPVHEHSYTETIIKEGTCSTWGTKLYTCSCGYSYEKEYALDHVSDGNRVINKQPDCMNNGSSSEHCIYCGIAMYGESIPTTEHVPKDHWEYFTHTGNYYLACSICNRVITSTTTRPEGAVINEITPIDSDTLQPVN